MPWYILALLVSFPVMALGTWASRKGNLPPGSGHAGRRPGVRGGHPRVGTRPVPEGGISGCVGRLPVGVVHRPVRPDPGPPEKTTPISVS